MEGRKKVSEPWGWALPPTGVCRIVFDGRFPEWRRSLGSPSSLCCWPPTSFQCQVCSPGPLPSRYVFPPEPPCDLIKGIKATDGRLLRWPPGVSWGQPVRTWDWRPDFPRTAVDGPLGPVTGNDGRQAGMGRGRVKRSLSAWNPHESSRLAS